jgi:hypothetical protein
MSLNTFPARRLMLACLFALGCATAQAENWPGSDWDSQLAAPSSVLNELDNCKRSINHVRQDKVCFQEAGAGEQFHGSSAS